MTKTQTRRNTFSQHFHPSHKLNWKPQVENYSAHFLQLHVWGNYLSDRFQGQSGIQFSSCSQPPAYTWANCRTSHPQTFAVCLE